MSFSENLVRLQAERHESNCKLAKAIGVHATTIQNWRDGKRPRLDHAASVASHYGLTVDEMVAEQQRKEAGKEVT